MAKFIIELIGDDVSICSMTGESVANYPDIADCRASGDCDPACAYVRDSLGVEFRTVARDETGQYVNRLATDAELQACCEAIYFESDSDFSDRATAELYLIWQAASQCEWESE